MKIKEIRGFHYGEELEYKCNRNYLGNINGLLIGHLPNGIVISKSNYINGKEYGLETWYNKNGKIISINYSL